MIIKFFISRSFKWITNSSNSPSNHPSFADCLTYTLAKHKMPNRHHEYRDFVSKLIHRHAMEWARENSGRRMPRQNAHQHLHLWDRYFDCDVNNWKKKTWDKICLQNHSENKQNNKRIDYNNQETNMNTRRKQYNITDIFFFSSLIFVLIPLRYTSLCFKWELSIIFQNWWKIFI